MIRLPIRNFEDLAKALRRFEELFGAPEGSVEAGELSDISIGLRAFEDNLAARIAARRCTPGSLKVMPRSGRDPTHRSEQAHKSTRS